jgi:uncharacterized protein (DUF2461 family)
MNDTSQSGRSARDSHRRRVVRNGVRSLTDHPPLSVGDHAYFGPDMLSFLRELKLHNDRDWFLANQQRYKADVQAPFLRLITDLAPALKEISGGFIADPSPNGGSMMRIYRDIRFSKDKSPYKA